MAKVIVCCAAKLVIGALIIRFVWFEIRTLVLLRFTLQEKKRGRGVNNGALSNIACRMKQWKCPNLKILNV